MSHSTLYGIRGDLTGEVLCEYVANSWLFVPVIWTTLYDKYVGDQALDDVLYARFGTYDWEDIC